MNAFKKFWYSLAENIYVIVVLSTITVSVAVLHLLASPEKVISWIKSKFTNHKS